MTLLSFEKQLGTRYTFTAEAETDVSAWEPMDRCGDETPAVWMPLEILAYDNVLNKTVYTYQLDIAFAENDPAPDFCGEYEWALDPETLSLDARAALRVAQDALADEMAATLEPSARAALKKYAKEA